MEIITKNDLNQFKEELFTEIRSLLKGENQVHKSFLKSKEVMELLGCSESKLSSLRISGKLPCRKLQGTYYYDMQDIRLLLSH